MVCRMHPPSQSSLFDGDLLVDHVLALQASIERTLSRLRAIDASDPVRAQWEANVLLKSLRLASDEIRRCTGEGDAPLPF